MAASLNQETINDTMKLIMHRLIARRLARDPSLVDRARNSLDEAARHFPDRSFIAEWHLLLSIPVCSLRYQLICRNEHMKRLRLSSPFVTAEGIDFTDTNLRRRIIRAAKRIAARAWIDRGSDATNSSADISMR